MATSINSPFSSIDTHRARPFPGYKSRRNNMIYIHMDLYARVANITVLNIFGQHTDIHTFTYICLDTEVLLKIIELDANDHAKNACFICVIALNMF